MASNTSSLKHGETPEGYACTNCGVTGVKLWRRFSSGPDDHDAFCSACAVKVRPALRDHLGSNDEINAALAHIYLTHQRFPAIPSDDGFCDFKNMKSAEGKFWWLSLDTFGE